MNMVTTVLVLFIILFYATSFYILVFRYECKRSAETILVHSKYQSKSFPFETFCYLLRNYLRSLIQSTLLPWYGTQLTLLCISNGLCITLCIYFRNYFLNRLTFILTVFYHITLLMMDTCFMTDLKYPSFFNSINYDLMILCIICLLLALLLAVTICYGIDNLYSFLCKRE